MMTTLTEKLIFDSHAHFDDSRFENPLEFLTELYEKWWVSDIINCAVDLESAKKCLSFSKALPFCHTAAGFHPQNLPEGEMAPHIDALAKILREEKIVAVGEIGLDYYWDISRKEEQIAYFKEQLRLANEFNLPVSVHDREAHGDTLQILKELKPKGVVHCFSGSVEMAKEILKLGMFLGVGGVVTFKNSKTVKAVVEETPIERILLETDSPYLAPEPFRGKTCHSGLIYYTAEKVAEIKNMSTEEVLKITNDNARSLLLKEV